MRVLLVKLSSLGDVIHNLPVVSDLSRAFPDMQIDWATETPYAEIAAMHPAVKEVLPVPLRKLKRKWYSLAAWRDFARHRSVISLRQYDRIVDTQGLLKSAWVSGWPRGKTTGFSAASAREPLAARFYDDTIDVPRDLHAVTRNRLLAAGTFGYEISDVVDYGINAPVKVLDWLPAGSFAVFLHATSRDNKRWPEAQWVEMGSRLREAGIDVVLPWGSAAEAQTSHQLAEKIPGAVVPPGMSLTDAAAMLSRAAVVIGVDTGLAHLSVALARPTVGLYITTQPTLTGLHGGATAVNLGGGNEESPADIPTDLVWNEVKNRLPAI